MIAKIIGNHGTGSAGNAVNYVKSKTNAAGEPRENPPEHLFGDGQQVIELTEAMTCKHTYLSSVLSFTKEESSKLSVDEIKEIAEKFAAHNAEPFGADAIAGCAYLHNENGRYDVHLLQVRMDLETGKRVDLFTAQAGDVSRLADFQDIQNHEYRLDDPRDPARARLTKDHVWGSTKKMRTTVNSLMEQATIEGRVTDRKSAKAELKKMGFEIARETKKAISIKSPDFKQNIRLQGAIYEQSFGGIKSIKAAIEASRRRDQQSRFAHYEQCVKRLAKNNERRSSRLSTKFSEDFSRRRNEFQNKSESQTKNDLHTIAISLRDARSDKSLDNLEHSQSEHFKAIHNNNGEQRNMGNSTSRSSDETKRKQKLLHQNNGVNYDRTNSKTNSRIQERTNQHQSGLSKLRSAYKQLVHSSRKALNAIARSGAGSDNIKQSFSASNRKARSAIKQTNECLAEVIRAKALEQLKASQNATAQRAQRMQLKPSRGRSM